MKIIFFTNLEGAHTFEQVKKMEYFSKHFTIEWGNMPLPLVGDAVCIGEYLISIYGEDSKLEWLPLYYDEWFKVEGVQWEFNIDEKCFMPQFNLKQELE